MNKDRIQFLSALMLAVCFSVVQPCQSETLRVIEQHSLDKYYGVTHALRAGRDTVMFIATGGLYVQGSSEQEWHKLIDCAPETEQVPFSNCDNDRLTRLVYPEGLWQHTAKSENEILIHESFCGRLYRICQSENGARFLETCDRRKGEDGFGNTVVQDGLILSALWGNDTKEKLVIQRINGDGYRKLFHCSEELVRWRDSVSLDHTYFCLPALNPHDSTLWLAIQGHSSVYIADMEGVLKDSVSITNAEYTGPPRIRSRINSDAVTADWFAQWTPITSFSYVPPGYFILQYKIGTDTCAGEKLNKFTTIVWDANKQIIPLTIDPRWRLAGVQDDGRIIFVAREADSSGCKEQIIVTRIEP